MHATGTAGSYDCKKTTTGSADGIKGFSYEREKNPPLFKIEVGLPTTTKKTKEESRMKLDTNSLVHTKWDCKYHIVFAPKYRRQAIYRKIKADIEIILRKLCEYKGVEIWEAEACKTIYICWYQYRKV